MKNSILLIVLFSSIILTIFSGCMDSTNNTVNLDGINSTNYQSYVVSVLKKSGIGNGEIVGITKPTYGNYILTGNIQYKPNEEKYYIDVNVANDISNIMTNNGWNETSFIVTNNGATLSYTKYNRTVSIYSTPSLGYIQIYYIEKNIEEINKINQQYIDNVRSANNYTGKAAKSTVATLN